MDECYQSRLTALDWEGVYRRCPGIYRALARRLARDYAVVLVDSRTGITDTSSVCTALLPDKLVVVFTPNRQSPAGIETLVQRSTEYRQGSKDLRPLMVYPLPSRIDNQFDALRHLWRHGDISRSIEGYQTQSERILRRTYALDECDLNTYFNEVQIQHSPEYSYGEPVAALDPVSGDRFSIVRSYRALMEWMCARAAPWEGPEKARARSRLKQLTVEARTLTAHPLETHRRIELLKEVVALSRFARGNDHPETVVAIEQLIEASFSSPEETPNAVELLDELVKHAQTSPKVFAPKLAATLSNLTNILSVAGRWEKALSTAKEATSIYRELVSEQPQAFMAMLAASLKNLTNVLSALDHNEEALVSAQETSDIYRELARAQPQAFIAMLAASLKNLTNVLSTLGRREEALAPAQEAASIYRQLAHAQPETCTPMLAASLDDLTKILSALGRPQEALAVVQETTDIYRRLVDAQPEAFKLKLAASLNNLASRLVEVGRREDALAVSQEALSLGQELVFVNGIDFDTGAYAVRPRSVEDLANEVRHNPGATTVGELHGETPQSFGLPYGVDFDRLEDAGWGIVFQEDTPPTSARRLLLSSTSVANRPVPFLGSSTTRKGSRRETGIGAIKFRPGTSIRRTFPITCYSSARQLSSRSNSSTFWGSIMRLGV